MKNYTEDILLSEGYTIRNARIMSTDLSMEDHGCLTFNMALEGGGWGVVYGGHCLGHGYLGAKEFDGGANSIEYIMRIMDTVGAAKLSELKGKYVRVATTGWGGLVKIIGNITDDKWFDAESFFEDKE